MAHGKAQLRRGTQSVKNADMYAVCGHDAGSLVREKLAVVSAVEADGYALFHCVLALGLDDISKGLSRVANDVDIHLMKAQLHRSAQSGRSELERREKAALYFLFIVCYGVELLPFGFAQCGAVQPALVLFLIIPHQILRSLRLN